MATVRITDQIKRDISNKIMADQRPAEVKLANSFTFGITASDMHEMFLVSYLKSEGVKRDVFDSLPAKWKDGTRTVEIRSINGVEVPYSYRTHNLPDMIPCPPGMYQNLMVQGDQYDEMAEKLAAHITATRELTEQHNAFKQGVNKVLNACTTLKQAIEMWPAIVHVLPQQILNRHNEVEVRTKKKKIEVDADLTDSLNAHVVGTKMREVIESEEQD